MIQEKDYVLAAKKLLEKITRTMMANSTGIDNNEHVFVKINPDFTLTKISHQDLYSTPKEEEDAI